jgi:hypothetical protein
MNKELRRIFGLSNAKGQDNVEFNIMISFVI